MISDETFTEKAGRAPAPSFFVPLGGERYESTVATVGPWSPALQHGGPPAALLGRALERLDPEPGGRDASRIARITFDFLGPIPVDELSVTTEVLRPGRRIALLQATASAGGRPVLRATGWRLSAEAGRSPAIGDSDPPPPLPAVETRRFFEGIETFPYGESFEWRFVDGHFARLGPATLWARMRIPIVPDETPSPLCRLLAVVDSANGASAELPISDWTFVPVDLSVVAHRHPEGEWIGIAARTTIGSDGIGLTEGRLFDARGVIGRSLQTLYVTPNKR